MDHKPRPWSKFNLLTMIIFEWCRQVLFVLLFTSASVLLSLPSGIVGENSELAEASLDHVIEKRAESSYEPHFKTGDLVVDEFIGTVMVCVIGGHGNRRSLAIYTAAGIEERCPSRPCPSATENVDYERLFVTHFELKQGERFCRNITIINDPMVEGREFFLVVLEDLRWGEVIETLAIVIEDEDSPTFTAHPQFVRENGVSVTICIMGGIANETVAIQTANVSTSVGRHATLGLDYSYVYEVTTISTEELICTEVPILDDMLYEGLIPESFEVVMYAINGSLSSDYVSSSATVFILEDDTTPQFGTFNQLVSEQDGTAMVCVDFRADSGVMVQSTLMTANLTALAGLDFEHFNETFTIQGGDSKCFSLILHDDTLPETYEKISLTLDSSNNVVDPFTAQITIADDDVLEFAETSYSVYENATIVMICVNLVSGVNSVINGTIRTLNREAVGNVDYVSIDQRFTLGGDRERCFNLFIINDNVPELTETVGLTVDTLSSLEQVVERRFVLLSILDDDADLCGPLQPPENGEIVSFTNELRAGSRVFYRCNPGYELVGLRSFFRTCLLNASWSEQDPSCQEIMCPSLDDPMFGVVQLTGRTIQSKALYSCLRGYRLEGAQERECLLSGRWSGPEPVCSEILCPVLPNITDGVVIITTRTVDSLAIYNCSDGFEIVGIDVRVCMEEGNWNGTEPICKATIDLPMPGPVGVQFVKDTPKMNGREVSVEFVTTGSTDTVICQLGTYAVVEDFTYRDSGGMTFRDMEPGVYTLTVTASNSLTGETAQVERFFELSDHPDFCGLHLINNGLTMTGNSIHVQLAGVPTTIETFRCKLDSKPGFDCSGEVYLDDIEPGAHRLKIMHNRHECGPRRKLFLHFTIE